jgi:hypothetical protein
MVSVIRHIALATTLVLSCHSSFAFYDAFPISDGPYISGPASSTLSWSGENFESYADGSLLECAANRYSLSHIDVTSGCLLAKYAGQWKRGWTESPVFRAVTIGRHSDGREIKWTNQTTEYRAYIKTWHNNGNIPDWSGLHAFVRYRTSDDLYVASVRYDGVVTIKRKWNGVYTTLAESRLNNEFEEYLDENGKLATGKWYQLKFSAIGNVFSLYLDGTLLLSTTSDTFSWGTTGIRIDNSNTWIDEWKLIY